MIDRVAAVLSGFRFRFESEAELQAGVQIALSSAGINHCREVMLKSTLRTRLQIEIRPHATTPHPITSSVSILGPTPYDDPSGTGIGTGIRKPLISNHFRLTTFRGNGYHRGD